MIKEMKGNLLDVKEGIIAHQVNCKGVMGAGVAKQIRNKLLTKEQYENYQKMCHKGKKSLLGSVYIYPSRRPDLYVANLFAENIPTGNGLDTDYDALAESLHLLKRTAAKEKLEINIPGYLGCGLAGGDWEYVYNHILVPTFGASCVNLNIYYLEDTVKKLWMEFGDIPMDLETECIERHWHRFLAGTYREEIWHWFEETFQVSVAEDLMGCEDEKRKAKRYSNSQLMSFLSDIVSKVGSSHDGVKMLLASGMDPEDLKYFGLPEDKLPNNTLVEYLYRDGSNYKLYSEAILPGILTDEEMNEITDCLDEGSYFLPGQVGLPDDNRYSGTEDDHPWFELEDISSTSQNPTTELTAKELLKNFRDAKDNWKL